MARESLFLLRASDQIWIDGHPAPTAIFDRLTRVYDEKNKRVESVMLRQINLTTLCLDPSIDLVEMNNIPYRLVSEGPVGGLPSHEDGWEDLKPYTPYPDQRSKEHEVLDTPSFIKNFLTKPEKEGAERLQVHTASRLSAEGATGFLIQYDDPEGLRDVSYHLRNISQAVPVYTPIERNGY